MISKIFTIGYTSTTPEELITIVDELGLRLVDIRISPYSQDYKWRQKSLEQYFGDKYLYIKEFGNENYKIGSIKVKDPVTGLAKIQNVIEKQPVLLMCACYLHEKCHRSVVANIVAERFNLEIEHLYGKSKSKASKKDDDEPQQLSLF
jgi:uncharacterized protein (DUF488 family)